MKNGNNIEPITQSTHNQSNDGLPENTPSVTLAEVLLAWLLGYVGAHKFYRKRIGMGFLYLITFGLFGIGWIGDAAWLTFRYFTERKGKENSKKQKVFTYIIAAVFCLLMFGSCGGSGETTVPSTEPPEATVYVAETTVETTSAPTESTTTATSAPIESATEVSPTQPTVVETEVPTTTSEEDVVETAPPTEETEKPGITYVLNTSTNKFHYPSCSSVDDMKESNKLIYTGTRDEVIAKGYEPCGRCHP